MIACFFILQEAIRLYEHRGLYLIDLINGGHEIRCACKNSLLEGDAAYFDRHFGFQCHKTFEENREKERVEQARLDRYAMIEKENEIERLKCTNTRSTKAVDEDKPFRTRCLNRESPGPSRCYPTLDGSRMPEVSDPSLSSRSGVSPEASHGGGPPSGRRAP